MPLRRRVSANCRAGCAEDNDDRNFTEKLTFAGADAILAMLHELCPNIVDGVPPVWVRNLAYRLALLQRTDDVALMREAAQSLWMHGPDWDDVAADLERRAAVLEAS